MSDFKRNSGGNLCVSNPEALRLTSNGAVAYVEQNPEFPVSASFPPSCSGDSSSQHWSATKASMAHRQCKGLVGVDFVIERPSCESSHLSQRSPRSLPGREFTVNGLARHLQFAVRLGTLERTVPVGYSTSELIYRAI